MSRQQTLLACYAHPDDEILGPGGTLAHYAANGAHVELVCATRGEAGEIADPALATPETLAQVREAELRCAAEKLGIQNITFLDYRDSGMEGTEDNHHPDAFVNAPASQVVPQLIQVIRRVQPQVILTFEPYGGYGHPDHIAIHHHVHAAFELAADRAYRADLGRPFQPSRLFYPILRLNFFLEMKARMEARGLETEFFNNLLNRQEKGWPDDKYHVVMDVAATVDQKWNGFLCHRTQFGAHNIFRRLPEDEMKSLLRHEYFALAVPEPEPGVQLRDLFDGL